MPEPVFEFTGERVIPGQVDPDLWNEHLARYLFAARLARHKHVLDLACGTGYGSAELARSAGSVVAVDRAPEAVQHARLYFARPNVAYVQGSVTSLPFADASFQLVTAFEVIEHLQSWRDLLSEARRVLALGGQFVVSTPNKAYYAETRQQAGPNPFHANEFEFDEFLAALAEFFPHVSPFAQNHIGAIVFQPLQNGHAAEVKRESARPAPETSHFFVAVCAMSAQTGSPAFIYLPTTANVLHEREQHIRRLEHELAQKDGWLAQSQSEHQALMGLFRDQQQELESRSRWARQLNEQLEEARGRIATLQDELAAEQAAGRETAKGYEDKIVELERELETRTRWAQETETRLIADVESRSRELAECVKLLDQAEKTIEERTLWAQSERKQVEQLQSRLSMVSASRWYRLGRRVGLGPEVRS